MRLGAITSYKVGYNKNGIEIINVFPEWTQWSIVHKRYIYYPTIYYILYDNNRGIGKEPFFVEEYKLNTLINMLEYGVVCLNSKLSRTKLLIKSLLPSNKTRKPSLFSK